MNTAYFSRGFNLIMSLFNGIVNLNGAIENPFPFYKFLIGVAMLSFVISVFYRLWRV